MARKKLELSNIFPYHVTNRSNNQEWFYLPIDQTWEIFCEILSCSSEEYKVDIHAFVLMSNHYHLMVTTSLGNIPFFMRYFQTEVARAIQKRCGRINHIFGGRYARSILCDRYAVAYVYKYILRNPVRACLVDRIQDYEYSSWSLMKKEISKLPVSERIDPLWAFLPKKERDRLNWLNAPTPKEQEELIRKALRRKSFKFSRGNEVRVKLEQLSSSYMVPFTPGAFSAEK